MSKHKLILVVIMFCLIGISTTHSRAAEPITIRIFVGIGTGNRPAQQQTQNQLADEWNSQNSDIKVAFEYYSTSDKVVSYLDSVTTDNPLDIVGPFGIVGYGLIQHTLEDLSGYIRENPEFIADLDNEIVKLLARPDGKVLTIPLGVYPSFLWVNEDAFIQANVPLPPKQFGQPYIDSDGKEYVWDYDKLTDVAMRVTQDENGHSALDPDFDPQAVKVYGYGDFWLDFRNIALRFGAADAGVSSNGKTATFDAKGFREAALWYHDGIFKHHFMPNLDAQGLITEATNPFESGMLAMWYCNSWYKNWAIDAPFKWGIYAAPANQDGKIIAPINIDGFAIVKNSKNKAAAWKVLQWLNSPSVEAKLCQAYGCTPAKKSARAAWERDGLSQSENYDLKVVYEAIKFLDIPNFETPLPGGKEVIDLYTEFFNTLQNDPSLDVPQALKELNKKIQTAYDAANKP